MNAFAEAGNRDLALFQEQWLSWTGAPALALGAVEFRDEEVVFTLEQEEPAYSLEIPVVLTTAAGTEEHIVVLDQTSGEFTLETAGVENLAVDPDCHLFRRLHQTEIEPTISQVLADEDPAFVIQGAAPDMAASARVFATDFSEKDEYSFHEDGALPGDGHASIVINPAGALLKQIAPQELMVSGTTLFLAGKRYSLKEYDLVFAGADPNDAEVTDLVILSDSPARLEALARRVGHYGKYSWLLLPVGQGKVLRGNWPVGDSPLMAAR